jgi:hypothetical protein
VTARSSISQASALSTELDQVTRALSYLSGTFTQAIVITGTDALPGAVIITNLAASTLNTMLTARKTAIQNALTALGVT